MAVNPVAQLKGIVESLNFSSKDRSLASVVLDDEKFPIWSASCHSIHHHYGKGGLAQHTFEVVDLCLRNNAYFPQQMTDERLLFFSALFHDAGKMWDYRPLSDDYVKWEGTEHKRNIHHISRSALVWQKAYDQHGSFQGCDEVLHAILAHHGSRQWGSPVTPNTKMAWLLHLCDGISARMDDGERCFQELPPK